MIPLVISNFNQLYYLINLINWWNFKTDYAPVYIVDNASTYAPLLEFYKNIKHIFPNVSLSKYQENNMKVNVENELAVVIHPKYEYYCISDPDISPLPNTPFNFLDIFKTAIDTYGFDHVGFRLKLDDLPDFYPKKEHAVKWESQFAKDPYPIIHEGVEYQGYRAPIDFTFSMYKTSLGGWGYPISRDRWNNSLRLLEAHHLGWYLPSVAPNKEMENYFNTARTWDQNQKDLKHGANNWNPNIITRQEKL